LRGHVSRPFNWMYFRITSPVHIADDGIAGLCTEAMDGCCHGRRSDVCASLDGRTSSSIRGDRSELGLLRWSQLESQATRSRAAAPKRAESHQASCVAVLGDRAAECAPTWVAGISESACPP
jgi:hypothetical protein